MRPSDRQQAPLVGRGRSADIYDLGNDKVLRRYRDGHDATREADAMRSLHALGYPVPLVYDASGPDIVMATVKGPTMMRDMIVNAHRMDRYAQMLVRLHSQLHVLPPPEGLKHRFGDAKSVLHLDLHPDNVILGPNGPVVIDWSNVCCGPPEADLAQTWIIMASSEIPMPAPIRALANLGRGLFLARFRRQIDVAATRRVFAVVAQARLEDLNVTGLERRRIKRLVSKWSTRERLSNAA